MARDAHKKRLAEQPWSQKKDHHSTSESLATFKKAEILNSPLDKDINTDEIKTKQGPTTFLFLSHPLELRHSILLNTHTLDTTRVATSSINASKP